MSIMNTSVRRRNPSSRSAFPFQTHYQIGNRRFIFFSRKERLLKDLSAYLLHRFEIQDALFPRPDRSVSVFFEELNDRRKNSNRLLRKERLPTGCGGGYFLDVHCGHIHRYPSRKGSARKIKIRVSDAFLRIQDLRETHFFNLIRLILLENRLLLLHSSAVAKDGVGLALPGDPGSGKTTSLLTLLREGFSFLADDHIALSSEKNPPIAYASNDEMHVLDETIEQFQELDFLKEKKPILCGNRWKKPFFAKELLTRRRMKFKHPLHLLVVLKRGEKGFRWRRFAKSEALLFLMKYCNIDLLCKEASLLDPLLDSIAKLVGSLHFYQLETSSRIESIPSVIRAIAKDAGYAI